MQTEDTLINQVKNALERYASESICNEQNECPNNNDSLLDNIFLSNNTVDQLNYSQINRQVQTDDASHILYEPLYTGIAELFKEESVYNNSTKLSDLDDYRDSNRFSLLASSKNKTSNSTDPSLLIEDTWQIRNLSNIESYRDTNQYSILNMSMSNGPNGIDTVKCSSFIDSIGNDNSMKNYSISEISNQTQTDKIFDSDSKSKRPCNNDSSIDDSSDWIVPRNDEIARWILLSILDNIGSESVNNSSQISNEFRCDLNLDEAFSIFHETFHKSIDQLSENIENSKTSC